MKAFQKYVLLMIALCSIRAAAQGDSVLIWPASVHVKRPDIDPTILVKTSYVVFTSKRMMRRYGKGNLSADVNLVSDLDASHTIYVQNPMPDLDSIKGVRNTFDFQMLMEERMGMKVKYANAPLLDTVQLKVRVSKHGKFSYDYVKRRKDCMEPEVRCMMALMLLDKWTPAIMYDVGKRERRVYSEIYLFITVSANPFKEELSTKK